MTILQQEIPYDPTRARPLPGIQPLDPKAWLQVDDAFAAQMAERERLLTNRQGEVLALDNSGRPAAKELLQTVATHLTQNGTHERQGNNLLRPDGVRVALTPEDPLGCLGRLHQADFCILERRGAEHVLTGAVLCFPASWQLSEKIMKPLSMIHTPVAEYTDDIARRVQRLFDGIKVGHPLWRFNALWYDDPALFQPRSENEPRSLSDGPDKALYMRSERQCLWRLAGTGAVIFSIHTYVIARKGPNTAEPGQ